MDSHMSSLGNEWPEPLKLLTIAVMALSSPAKRAKTGDESLYRNST